VLTDFVVSMAHPATLVSQETLVHQDVMVYPVKKASLDHLVDIL